jgi:hypothetical protein
MGVINEGDEFVIIVSYDTEQSETALSMMSPRM